MKKWLCKHVAVLIGSVTALFLPLVPIVLVVFIFIIADTFSAYRLGRRVAQKARAEGVKVCADVGKFFSKKSLKIIDTMGSAFFAILLAHLLDVTVLKHLANLHLANYVAGIICTLQGWSILENMSSCNGASWAKALQKVMVDKTKRHLNVDIFKESEKNE